MYEITNDCLVLKDMTRQWQTRTKIFTDRQWNKHGLQGYANASI